MKKKNFLVPNSCTSVPEIAVEVPITSASVPVLAYEKVPFEGEHGRERCKESFYQKNETIQNLEWIGSGSKHYMFGSSPWGIGARGFGHPLRGLPAPRLLANGLVSTHCEGCCPHSFIVTHNSCLHAPYCAYPIQEEV